LIFHWKKLKNHQKPVISYNLHTKGKILSWPQRYLLSSSPWL